MLGTDKFFNQSINVVFHSDFENPEKFTEILGAFPDKEEFDAKRIAVREKTNPIRHTHIDSLTFKEPLLNKAQEVHLFKKMNLFKYLAVELRNGEHPVTLETIQLFNQYMAEAQIAYDQIVISNLRIVSNVIKKLECFHANKEEYLNEGYFNVGIAAIKFDVSLGFKFSTFCTWVVRNNLLNYRRSMSGYYKRFTFAGNDPVVIDDAATEVSRDHVANETYDYEKVIAIIENLEADSAFSKKILALRHYFGLGYEAKDLKQTGVVLKLCKERIRQMKIDAINKIKEEYYGICNV